MTKSEPNSAERAVGSSASSGVKRFWSVLAFVIGLLTDPILVVLILGPMVLGIVFGRLVEKIQAAGSQVPGFAIIIDTDAPNMLDYAIQVHSAAASWAVLSLLSIMILLNVLNRRQEMPEAAWKQHHWPHALWLILSLVIFIYGLAVLIAGGAAETSVVESYFQRQIDFGLTMPVMTTRVFFLRVAVGVAAVLLILLRYFDRGRLATKYRKRDFTGLPLRASADE